MVTIWRDSAAESSEIHDNVYDNVHDSVYDSVGGDKSLTENELSGGGCAVEKRTIE